MCDFELSMVLEMFLKLIRKSHLMQRAADYCLRLLLFGDGHCKQAFFTSSHPAKSPYEIGEVGALHQQLGQDGVIVVVRRHMAVAAIFGLTNSAHGVWDVGAKRNAAQSLRRNSLLLDINRFAILIV